MSGLRGRSVVITRSRSQAGPLAAALLERGGIPVFFPTIDIRPLDDCSALDCALRRADRYDWIVFTSVNTVNAVWGRLARLGRVELTGSSRIAAVGPATVTALAERGISTTTMPAEFRGSAIAATMGQVAGRRVLLPHAALAREETAASLRAAGAIVDEVVAYQTLPPVPDGASLAALEGEIDAVTFTSPSTVRNFVTLAGPGALALLARTVVACLGPVTGAAVTDLGLGPPILAAQATSPALLDALEAHFARPARTT